MDEYDLSKGEILKREGIERVSVSAKADEWKTAFVTEAESRIKSGRPFSAEDITKIIGQPPTHPNLVGAQMNILARAGKIRLVGFKKATRVNRHAGRVGVWVGVV